MTLSAGATIAGRYALDSRLGAGGMASVWLAEDTRLGRSVAVKVIADTLAGDDQWLARFEREARAAAAVTHPHVVGVFDYGIEDESPYLVMEHVSGGTLADRLRDGGGGLDTRRLARQLLGALDAVHAAGILHRDVKPANVLLDAQGDVRLTDFGIAQPEDATSLTQTGVVIGTAQFMAPEVLAGAPASRAGDLYAAGMVLQAALRGDDRDPRLHTLVAALTDPDPDRRPTAQDALATLRETPAQATTDVLRPPPIPGRAPAPAPPPPAARPRRGVPPGARNLAIAIVAVVLVVALALAAGGGGDDGRVSSPAPVDAPALEQLDRLEQLVDEAER